MRPEDIQKISRDLAEGRFPAAQKRARSLAKRAPKDAVLQNLAGAAFAQAGKHREAIPYFRAATRIDA